MLVSEFPGISRVPPFFRASLPKDALMGYLFLITGLCLPKEHYLALHKDGSLISSICWSKNTYNSLYRLVLFLLLNLATHFIALFLKMLRCFLKKLRLSGVIFVCRRRVLFLFSSSAAVTSSAPWRYWIVQLTTLEVSTSGSFGGSTGRSSVCTPLFAKHTCAPFTRASTGGRHVIFRSN